MAHRPLALLTGALLWTSACLAESRMECVSESLDAGILIHRPELNNDLYERWREETANKTSKQVQSDNRRTIRALARLPEPTPHPGRRTSLNEDEVRSLFDAVKTNPVSNYWPTQARYDPEQTIGFCFGRAMTAHLEALSRGLHKDSIRKIWIIGNLQAGSSIWGFHVATMVRQSMPRTGRQKPRWDWRIIDPNYSGPLQVAEWVNLLRTGDTVDGKARIYITEASKFGASAPKYSPGALGDDFYHGFFIDLLRHYREKGKPMRADEVASP